MASVLGFVASRAVADSLQALANLVAAAKPDPAVAAARAERLVGLDDERRAHHIGALERRVNRLLLSRGRLARARLAGVRAELRELRGAV